MGAALLTVLCRFTVLSLLNGWVLGFFKVSWEVSCGGRDWLMALCGWYMPVRCFVADLLSVYLSSVLSFVGLRSNWFTVSKGLREVYVARVGLLRIGRGH